MLPDTAAMLDELREAWQFNDLMTAWGIIKWGLAHPNVTVQTMARDTLTRVLQRTSSAKKAANALVPLLTQGLLDKDLEIQRQAVIALQVVAKKKGDLGPALMALGDCLTRGGDIAAGAARAIWLGGLGRTDLGTLTGQLEAALESSDTNVRAYASKALSRYLCQKGLEPRLEAAHANAWVVPGGWEYMDGPVAVEASHRRTYAATDEEIADVALVHLCSVCGSKETRCVYYEIDAGPSWKLEKYEVLCLKCKKYTVYEYDW